MQVTPVAGRETSRKTRPLKCLVMGRESDASSEVQFFEQIEGSKGCLGSSAWINDSVDPVERLNDWSAESGTPNGWGTFNPRAPRWRMHTPYCSGVNTGLGDVSHGLLQILHADLSPVMSHIASMRRSSRHAAEDRTFGSRKVLVNRAFPWCAASRSSARPRDSARPAAECSTPRSSPLPPPSRPSSSTTPSPRQRYRSNEVRRKSDRGPA
jgi:hypothetical protein